jgi:ArsR family transcriptional regulator
MAILCAVADMSDEMTALIARRFAVLGEPTRLRLLNLIHARGEVTVGELVEATDTGQANVSKHLAVLRAERMVVRRRSGSHALYRVADPGLIRLCDEVCAGVRQELQELSSVAGSST